MRVRVTDDQGSLTVSAGDGARSFSITGLSEHDLRDLEFALAQRRAMSRRCEASRGEHTCAQYLGHVEAHLCRACTESWSGNAG